jgi:hypothetical protein
LRIQLHIDRLVLDGLPVDWTSGPAIKAAVEAELTRLLSKGGLAPELASGIVVPALRGGSINVADKVEPAALGRDIAGAVYGGIRR